MREAWHRLSSREQRMVAVAAGVVLVALAWIGIWRPMNADIARLTRDVPRLESLASTARTQADDIVALGRVAAPPRADPLPAAERVLAERNLRAAASGMDTNWSTTVVPTCSARNTRTSRERLRCRPTVRNRGQLLVPANRPVVRTPSSTAAVSRSIVTRPVALVAYHRAGPWRKALMPGSPARRASRRR